ncbi:hypothetical protein GCM10028817_40640 [Spirosoma pomorum]
MTTTVVDVAAEQVVANVHVTEYTSFIKGLMSSEVVFAPVDQSKVPVLHPPTVKVVERPAQIVDELIVSCGTGLTVMVVLTVALHPWVLLIVTE